MSLLFNMMSRLVIKDHHIISLEIIHHSALENVKCHLFSDSIGNNISCVTGRRYLPFSVGPVTQAKSLSLRFCPLLPFEILQSSKFCSDHRLVYLGLQLFVCSGKLVNPKYVIHTDRWVKQFALWRYYSNRTALTFSERKRKWSHSVMSNSLHPRGL